MSSNLLRNIAVSIGGMVLAAGMFTTRAQADQWDKMTLLTLDQPTQVGDTYLAPGTYMFKLAPSEADRHIVQIFNKDRSHLINTIIAIPSYRLEPTAKTVISYWETPPGTARAVRDWYYPGDYFGEEFRYPTNLRQVAAVTPAPQPPPPLKAEVTPAQPPVVDQEEETTTAQVIEQAPAPETQQAPVEVAQNNPPPSTVQEQTPAQPSAQPEEQNLPKTASTYPLIGLTGLLALGLYTVLRVSSIA